jgi:hypothetical protein
MFLLLATPILPEILCGISRKTVYQIKEHRLTLKNSTITPHVEVSGFPEPSHFFRAEFLLRPVRLSFLSSLPD